MISETDLIIKNNNIYHIDVNRDNVSETIILVGDQNRVPLISNYFSKITHKSQHREFVIHTGWFNNKYLSVIGTGIGPDNIDIVVNELDAIFNIDLKTRKVKNDITSLNLIRLGTCGTIREDIDIDSIVVSEYGLGLDNLLHFYKNSDIFYKNAKEMKNYEKLYQQVYLVEGDKSLCDLFSEYKKGITVTSPGFYGPQGRNLRIKNTTEYLIDSLSNLSYKSSSVINFEMETSALYGLANLGGHKALTLCTVVANRVKKEFSKNSNKAIKNMVEIFLNKITLK